MKPPVPHVNRAGHHAAIGHRAGYWVLAPIYGGAYTDYGPDPPPRWEPFEGEVAEETTHVGRGKPHFPGPGAQRVQAK